MSRLHSRCQITDSGDLRCSRIEIIRNCVLNWPSTPEHLTPRLSRQHASEDQQKIPLRVNEVLHTYLRSPLTLSRGYTSRVIQLEEFATFSFLGRDRKEQRWAELEDRILILLEGRLECLDLFRKLYDDGLQNATLLESVACLSTRKRLMERDEACPHFKNISAVASYLSVGRAKKSLKAALLRTIIICLSPIEAQWQVLDSVIDATLDFVTQKSIREWEYMDHTETVLIWELRAMSLRLLHCRQERVIRLAKSAETASVVISAGAKLIEEGVSRSGNALSGHIENAGLQVKGYIPSNNQPILVDRDAVVAITLADSLKRVSKGAKESTKVAIETFRHGTVRGVRVIATKFEQGGTGDSLPTECCEALRAAGKVGVATIGAAAIVGEALLETSRALIETTASVTADVVHHRYGSSAGKVASDAGETAINIVCTLGNVAVVSGGATALATTVVKENAKIHAASEAEKGMEALMMMEGKAKTFSKRLWDRMVLG